MNISKHNKVGLGTFPLASPFNKVSQKDAEKVIRTFIDNGGYYIDTAPLYGNGYVEKLLGKILSNIDRDKYYLGTKTVKHVTAEGEVYKSGKYKDIIEQFENSLLRLKVEYVDQLMVHSPDNDVPIEETLRAMEELVKSGKVKELAVSNVNLDELKEYNRTGSIKYIQNKYSLINRSLSKEFQKYLNDNKIYLIPWHLLEIGLLTNQSSDGIKLRKDDFRRTLSYWDNNNQEVISRWVREKIALLAKKAGMTIPQLNICWAFKQSFIEYVVVGTTNSDNLLSNLKADNLKISDEIFMELEKAYLLFEESVKAKYGLSVKEFRGLNDKYY